MAIESGNRDVFDLDGILSRMWATFIPAYTEPSTAGPQSPRFYMKSNNTTKEAELQAPDHHQLNE